MHQALNFSIFNKRFLTPTHICVASACVLAGCQPSLDGVDLSQHFESIISPCLSADYVLLGKYRGYDVAYNISLYKAFERTEHDCEGEFPLHGNFSYHFDMSENGHRIYIGNLKDHYYGPDKCKDSPTDIASEDPFPLSYRSVEGLMIVENSCDGFANIHISDAVFSSSEEGNTFISDYTSPKTDLHSIACCF